MKKKNLQIPQVLFDGEIQIVIPIFMLTLGLLRQRFTKYLGRTKGIIIVIIAWGNLRFGTGMC